MLRYLWHKNKTLCKIGLWLSSIVIVIGAVFMVDAIQREDLYSAELVTTLEPNTDFNTIPEFNVEGLTDKEIEELILRSREERANGEKRAE